MDLERFIVNRLSRAPRSVSLAGGSENLKEALLSSEDEGSNAIGFIDLAAIYSPVP